MMSIKSLLEDHSITVQDVTQTYIQGYNLERAVYIHPTAQFQISQASTLNYTNRYTDFPNLKTFRSKSTILSWRKILNLIPRTVTLHFITKQGNITKHYKTHWLYISVTLWHPKTINSLLTDKISEDSNLNHETFPLFSFLASISTKNNQATS